VRALLERAERGVQGKISARMEEQLVEVATRWDLVAQNEDSISETAALWRELCKSVL
jgi:hypothetical protein